MTATRASAFRWSAAQPSAAGSGFPRLMAEKPKPGFPMPVAVTRHLEMFLTFALLHLGQHAVLPLPRGSTVVTLSLPVTQRRGIHAFGAGFS